LVDTAKKYRRNDMKMINANENSKTQQDENELSEELEKQLQDKERKERDNVELNPIWQIINTI
jgi:hypothetical protein